VGDAIGICGSFRSASKDLARDLNDAVHKDAGRKRRRAQETPGEKGTDLFGRSKNYAHFDHQARYRG